MNAVNLNFTGVQLPKFEAAPEGEYNVTLVGCLIKPGKSNPENLVAHLTYEIADGEFAGKKIWNYQTVTGPEIDPAYVKLWLEALTGSELDGEFTLDPEELIGLTCVAFVGLEADYKDDTKERNVIKYYVN